MRVSKDLSSPVFLFQAEAEKVEGTGLGSPSKTVAEPELTPWAPETCPKLRDKRITAKKMERGC